MYREVSNYFQICSSRSRKKVEDEKNCKKTPFFIFFSSVGSSSSIERVPELKKGAARPLQASLLLFLRFHGTVEKKRRKKFPVAKERKREYLICHQTSTLNVKRKKKSLRSQQKRPPKRVQIFNWTPLSYLLHRIHQNTASRKLGLTQQNAFNLLLFIL